MQNIYPSSMHSDHRSKYISFAFKEKKLRVDKFSS